MKATILSCLLALIQAIAFAQFKTVAETPLFKEPESGFAKLLQLKNGNTVVIHLTNRSGINLTFYDPQHKLSVNKHHDPIFQKLRGARVNAIFEADGAVVIMISEVEERTPMLYRLVFDGVTGNLQREEKIAEAEKFQFKDVRWIPEFDPVNSFSVSKDPYSDNYAVFIRRNRNEFADKNQMEVVMYDGQHHETNRAYYQPPYKYASLNYLDMAVLGDDRVCILGFAYNQIAASDREGQLVLLSLTKGARKMKAELLDLPDDRIADSAIVRFNPVTKKLMLLGTSHIEDANPQPYSGFLAIIDPLKGKTEQFLDIYPSEADAQKKKLFGPKQSYTGTPQDLVLHTDGSYSIVYEELNPEKHEPLNGQPYTYYNLDNMAISNFDTGNKVTFTSFIPKKQYLKNTAYSSFYLAHRNLSAQQFILGDQYRSFSYLNIKDRMYVLMNDAEQNKGIATEEVIQLKVPSNGQAYIYTAGTTTPERTPFFGKLKKDETHALSVFNIADYNSERNLYVTLKLEVTAKGKGAKLVWLAPEE